MSSAEIKRRSLKLLGALFSYLRWNHHTSHLKSMHCGLVMQKTLQKKKTQPHCSKMMKIFWLRKRLICFWNPACLSTMQTTWKTLCELLSLLILYIFLVGILQPVLVSLVLSFKTIQGPPGMQQVLSSIPLQFHKIIHHPGSIWS